MKENRILDTIFQTVTLLFVFKNQAESCLYVMTNGNEIHRSILKILARASISSIHIAEIGVLVYKDIEPTGESFLLYLVENEIFDRKYSRG